MYCEYKWLFLRDSGSAMNIHHSLLSTAQCEHCLSFLTLKNYAVYTKERIYMFDIKSLPSLTSYMNVPIAGTTEITYKGRYTSQMNFFRWLTEVQIGVKG